MARQQKAGDTPDAGTREAVLGGERQAARDRPGTEAGNSRAERGEDEDGCVKLMGNREQECVTVDVQAEDAKSGVYKEVIATVTNNCRVPVSVAVCAEGNEYCDSTSNGQRLLTACKGARFLAPKESKRLHPIIPLHYTTGVYGFAFVGTTGSGSEAVRCRDKHGIVDAARNEALAERRSRSASSGKQPGQGSTSAGEADYSEQFAKCSGAWTGGHNPQVSTQCQAACLSRVAATLNRNAGETAAAQQYNQRADTYCAILSDWGAAGDCAEYCR